MDLGSIFGLGRVLGGSWVGLGRPWGRHGRPRSILDRFWVDFEARLAAQTDPNRSKIDAKIHSNRASVFGSIFHRLLMDFGIHLGTIFGSCWASSGGSAT